MLLLSMRYSETAINVNIFMCGGLPYFYVALLSLCSRVCKAFVVVKSWENDATHPSVMTLATPVKVNLETCITNTLSAF